MARFLCPICETQPGFPLFLRGRAPALSAGQGPVSWRCLCGRAGFPALLGDVAGFPCPIYEAEPGFLLFLQGTDRIPALVWKSHAVLAQSPHLDSGLCLGCFPHDLQNKPLLLENIKACVTGLWKVDSRGRASYWLALRLQAYPQTCPK